MSNTGMSYGFPQPDTVRSIARSRSTISDNAFLIFMLSASARFVGSCSILFFASISYVIFSPVYIYGTMQMRELSSNRLTPYPSCDPYLIAASPSSSTISHPETAFFEASRKKRSSSASIFVFPPLYCSNLPNLTEPDTERSAPDTLKDPVPDGYALPVSPAFSIGKNSFHGSSPSAFERTISTPLSFASALFIFLTHAEKGPSVFFSASIVAVTSSGVSKVPS